MNRNQNNLIKYTLESFIGKPITEIEVSERQKEAIQRLLNLKDEKFEELCKDVTNEIFRRNGMSYDLSNKMCEKFSMLSLENFKNLVVDVLVVYYEKNTDQKPETMPVFLNNLETLILNLKIESEKESFLNKVKDVQFYQKIMEFIDYMKPGKSNGIAEYMKECVESEIRKDNHSFLDSLSFPKILINEIEDCAFFKYLSYESTKEFNERKLNILTNLEEKENEIQVKNDLIKIVEIIIMNSRIPARKIQWFETEIKTVIQNLDIIKNGLRANKSIEIKPVYDNILEAVDKVYEKTKNLDFIRNRIKVFTIYKNNGPGYFESKTNAECYELVIGMAKDFSNFFKEISVYM